MKDFLKKFFSQYKRYLIFFGFGVPLIIYLVFKIPAPFHFLDCNEVWTAGDILGYYGILVGAFIAFLGVSWTIQLSQQQFKEDMEARARPFFVLSKYEFDIKVNLLGANKSEETSNDSHYIEFIRDRYYLTIENKKTRIRSQLGKEQEQLIKTYGLGWQAENNSSANFTQYNLVQQPIVSHVFEIENVGAGPTNTFRVEFNPVDTVFSKKGITLSPFKIGQKCFFHLFSQDDSKDVEGEYNLDLIYEDIYRNQYLQRYVFQMKMEPDETIRTFCLSGDQQKLESGKATQ